MVRELTLEALIKQINLNGGKTAPLYAAAIDNLSKRVNFAITQMEAAKDHKIFWDAVNECRKAGEELESVRYATGFISREEYKKDRELLKALAIGYVSTTICMIALLVGYYG